MGIGGEFAAGAALVAEVMPPNVRAKALGMLQALSAVGNIAAGFSLRLIPYMPHLGWRGLYLLGAAPALIAVIVQLGLREPDRWVQAKEAAREAGNNAAQGFGRYSDLFTNPRWRHNALALVWGLVGFRRGIGRQLGIGGVYSPELIDHALSTLSAADVNRYKSWAFVLQHSGAFAGILGFSYVGVWFGRRLAFLLAFIVAWISVLVVFTGFHRPDQIWYMFPLLGFGTLAPFGLYAVYFPEIFPTKLRTTGTGFCYNVGRYLSVAGVLLMPSLAPALHGFLGLPGFRAAAVFVSCCYLIGIVSVLWAPETKGRPLPEDEVSRNRVGRRCDCDRTLTARAETLSLSDQPVEDQPSPGNESGSSPGPNSTRSYASASGSSIRSGGTLKTASRPLLPAAPTGRPADAQTARCGRSFVKPGRTHATI